jgi:uncharacterized membrane protein YhaH (DUF805 family)
VSTDNPYSAPQSSVQIPAASGNGQGIWRDGKRLVVHKQAVLPPICVKTNEPSERTIKRKFYWHHPAVYLAILLNVLIYIVLALIIRKRHDLEVPLSEATAGKRRTRIVISWVLALGAVALFIASCAWMLQPGNQEVAGYGAIGLIAAAVILIIGSLIGSRASSILSPKRMTESATWFTGAHWEYLERLPQVPPNV